MDDIVKRLHARQSMRTWSGTGDTPKQALFADTLCHEAANEIDRLRAQLNEAIKDADRAIGHARSVYAAERETLRAALELIAAPVRPDGTWNRDREACRQMAAEALGRYEDWGLTAEVTGLGRNRSNDER